MKPYFLGLTGSIATGKSTTARMLRRLHIPVFDADEEVHRLLSHDEAVFELVKNLFLETIVEGRIERAKLGSLVFQDEKALAGLEEILHPRVKSACQRFMAEQTKKHTPLAVLDIPLLFEKGYEALCDKVMVTTCRGELQQERVMARPGMTLEKFKKITDRQLSLEEKTARADFILTTNTHRLETFRQLRDILDQVCTQIQHHENHRP
jgi:dephospho-CoA kinase